MMCGRVYQHLTWRRLLLWSLAVFLVASYLAEWWSVGIEKEVVDGKNKYRMKARIHVGYADPPPTPFNALGPIRQDRVLGSFGNRTKYHGGNKQVTAAPNRKNKFVTANIPYRRTTQKPRIPGRVTPQQDASYHNTHGALRIEDIPVVDVKGANCEALFRGNRNEKMKAEQYQSRHPKIKIPDRSIMQQAENCGEFIKDRKYITAPVNQEEADFPIAFSILLFKDVEMVERLLRAIYRPQNYYCIHVDSKSASDVRRAMEAIAGCFDNVFMSSRSVDVEWGWYSVLEPEIVCMEDLWKYAHKWKYFINLTGQEFPLKTNWELVKILKAYNGANDMETTIERKNPERTEYIHKGFYPTSTRKKPCPVDVTLAKGSVHVAVQRGFVDFVLHSPAALHFRAWVKDTGVPDETFFSSLNVSPQLGVPGATTGNKETNKDTNPFLTRFKNWGTWPFDFPCAGQRVRMVCIFSLGDLPLLASRPEMFANKFYLDYHPLAYDCMEQRHFNKTRMEVSGDAFFHDEYYRSLDFVKHHVLE